MPREATGHLRTLAGGGWEARVTLAPGNRKGFEVLGCHTEEEAQSRCRLMADFAKRFRKAGHEDMVQKTLEMAAMASTPEKRDGIVRAVAALCSGEARKVGTTDQTTFREIGERWTSVKSSTRRGRITCRSRRPPTWTRFDSVSSTL